MGKVVELEICEFSYLIGNSVMKYFKMFFTFNNIFLSKWWYFWSTL